MARQPFPGRELALLRRPTYHSEQSRELALNKVEWEPLTFLLLPRLQQQEFSTPLDMTKKLSVAIVIAFASICPAIGQEAPTPSSSLTPEESATPLPTPEQTPSTPARNVRLSFVPPPLEGTISLGIYDGSGKLVRVLNQQAQLDEFTVGA